MWGWGGMGLGPVLLILLMVLAVWGVVSLTRRAEGNQPSPDNRQSAFAILDERFAKGVIDAKEYEARRKVLKS